MPSRTRRARLRIEGLALPVGKRGLAPRRRGRADVHLAVLDRVDEAPAVSGDARVEADVDMGFADVVSEDERGAGLLCGGVAVAQYVEQNAFSQSRAKKADQMGRNPQKRAVGGCGCAHR